MTTEPHWDHFDDTRGAGVVGVGATLASAFGEAGRAITALVTDLADVTPREDIEIKVRGRSREELLSGWMDAVIREMDSRQMLFADFEVFVGDGEVVARVQGERLDPDRHHPAVLPRRILGPAKLERAEEDTWIARGVVEVERPH